ncbi:stress-activated map kinase interacting protein 1-domain-containing protein [Suillus clintonianus]|uniref:stress-activated map kinase interacting protein 1-domain-containing protein n=1 Tax=Suillus clintonianus TaxID=1904413 RepID=UPI001B8730C4|nr:stress-activated map kinase interacting protein 1-domain-containing protein [Suillus clintonianus]KAG2140578.1 stress-activated map kinase interacting protein 1-domain-containing protein [Suillus clintonianus]
MSLISDPGYLVHSLRLSYLRNVDDPYGARTISLSPSYTSNPYILAASLADVHRWPELEYPSSPPISDDESEAPDKSSSGFPGATGLKHHQTIMGNRSGAFGLRVSGRRASTSKRASLIAKRANMHNEAADAPAALPRVNFINAASDVDTCPITSEQGDVTQPLPLQHQPALKKDDPPLEPPPRDVPFVPKFKGAAEMEARRRLRMMARRGVPASMPKVPSVPTRGLNPDFSSSDDEDGMLEDDNDDDYDLVAPGDDNMDEADEFDPDFAATRGAHSDSASDGVSILSGTASVLSGSNISTLGTSPFVAPYTRARSRLSPVSEHRAADEVHEGSLPTIHSKPIETYFEMISPIPKPDQRSEPAPQKQETRRRGVSISLPVIDAPSDMTFTRKPVVPARQHASALTAILASSGGPANPFSELYGAISGRGETASVDVKVYFPHAKEPHGEHLTLNVRKDATMEEVIGFALWTYWDERWLPELNAGVKDDDPKLSAIGWIMRIAEDDGEVDEDFPPPDRTGKISKFGFDAFAILAATPLQIQQNEQLETKIQRRPSRVMAAPKKQDSGPPGGLTLPSVSGPTSANFGTTPILSSSLGPSSSHGPQLFLRIRVADTADAVHISTTIPVSAGMYMQEVLELVCRKRKLANLKDYALVVNELTMLAYLDRTVASLGGRRELTLVKRSTLPQLGIEPESRSARTTDPNASISKRISDVPEMQLSSAADYATAYKKYTIYRKMPMLARQERTLAIDGVYLHIMPSTNRAKAVFDSGKTVSFHIKSIIQCQQSAKSSTLFKIIVQRDSGSKRYDFEADTPKLAGEIVQTLRMLKSHLDRSSTVNRSRRSRHVV